MTGVLVLAGAVLCSLSVAVTVSGSDSDQAWLEAFARASMVGVPIAVGIYARRRPPFGRFGDLLVVAGGGWFLTTLSGSGDPVLHSAGRVAGWLVELWLLYLVLAFPTGRLPARVDRALVGALTIVIAALYLPTALVVEHYPVPSPWATCVADCPANAFMLANTEPAFVEDMMRPLREALSAVIFLGAAVRLALRIAHARPLTRRTLAPVLAVAAARVALFTAGFTARRADADAELVRAIAWLIALAVPVTALAFLFSLVRWRLYVAGAMHRLAAGLPANPEPEEVRAALARAFGDPGLEIVYWLEDGEGRWGDERGRPVTPQLQESERWLTEVYDGSRKVAGIVHDAALREERAFVDAATSYAAIALDNHRLAAQTASLLRAVRASRARIQATADEERRQIERELHEGAQQRLVALRIRLQIIADEMDSGGREGDPALLRELGTEVDRALDEIRSLARGIYPAPLERGLEEALRSAALQAAVPTTVLATGVGRYRREVEAAAYFCCLEALQNAAKHARGATAAVVDLSEAHGALRMEVRDDGAGYDPAQITEGVGLVSMRDRLAAVGGELVVESAPGHGTRVRATIPISG